MNEERLYQLINEKEQGIAVAMPRLMRKVYLWMTFALVITGLTAHFVASSPGIMTAIIANKALFWGLLIGELAFVVILSGMINRLSLTAATLLFVAYSVLNGVTMSFIFLAYTMTSIAQVFFIAAGTFAAMAAVGLFIKRDLSFIGRIAIMALLGLIIATVVNVFFLHNGGFNLVLSYIGVLLFTGLTAYDSQNIKNMLLEADNMSEEAHKIALLGALDLYLDFINLFLYMLRIFGSSKD